MYVALIVFSKYDGVTSLRFLQMMVTLDATMSMVVTRYAHKPERGPPLDILSAHPSFVHGAWPNALRSACLRLSTFRKGGLAAIREFDDVFYRFLITQAPTPVARLRPRPQNSLWLVLGFHPAYEKVVQRALATFLKDHDNLTSRVFGSKPSLGVEFDSIRIAWKNALPCFLSVLRNIEWRRTGKAEAVRV